jgi:hypothetical protein
MASAVLAPLWLALSGLAGGTSARAEVCNLKVVTDANPDYTDVGSMIHSITSNWPQTKDKCWARNTTVSTRGA